MFCSVGPFAAWVVKLQQRETRCECHRSELEQGKHVDCGQTGRLLHFSYDHAMKYGVAEAGTQASFGGHQDLLEEAVGLYRRTLATAKQKIWPHGCGTMASGQTRPRWCT